MFEVGFTELLLIFALALLVLGPQKLPKLAQQVGRWVGRARAMARQFRDQLEEEAHTLETKMSIDPGIDTSLDKRDAGPGPAPPAQSAPPAPPAGAPVTEDAEDFYPPEHHSQPANRSVAEAADSGRAPDAAGENEQGELDLTTSREAPPKAP
jgi:sec-independent protein translocase protein TatB